MSELRRDPLTGTWVAIAAGREQRPLDVRLRADVRGNSLSCPFCPGREKDTPREVAAVRPGGGAPDGPGWLARIVPNKYPVFVPAAGGGAGPVDREVTFGIYDRAEATGAHEVVIATPQHEQHLSQLSVDHFDQLLALCQHRMRTLLQDTRVRYCLLFHNHGVFAGASRLHPHLQIVGLPVDPEAVMTRLESCQAFYKTASQCLLCRILSVEESQGERIVHRDAAHVSIVPFAARVPYEILVVPRVHRADFLELPQGERRRLASHLKDVLGRLRQQLNDPPFNWMLVTGPRGTSGSEAFHWHLSITPRLSVQAGVEWGAGVFVNAVAPERAAEHLRAAADIG